MISLNPPALNISGLTILRDQADEGQWYYCPAKARLALTPEGKPMFLLARSAPDFAAPPGGAAGGASLNVAVNLRVDADVLASVAQAIQKQAKLDRAPLLAPVQYSEGTTRLIFLEAAARAGAASASAAAPGVADFIEKASFAATPSLYGSQDTVFALTLGAEGFTLLEGIIGGEEPPLVGVVYDLAFQAMRPELGVELNVSWEQVNEQLSRRFGAAAGAQRLAAQTDIDAATDALLASKAIQMTSQTAAALDWVKTFITDKFFTPSLTPPKFDVPAYSFKGVTQDELKDLGADLEAGSIIESRLAPQARISELTAPYPPGDLIRVFNPAGGR
jgi:hypothetical protein